MRWRGAGPPVVRWRCLCFWLCGAGVASAQEKESSGAAARTLPTPQSSSINMLRIRERGVEGLRGRLAREMRVVLTRRHPDEGGRLRRRHRCGARQQSNAEAKRRGFADRAAFYVQDVFKADLSQQRDNALLLPAMMMNLRRRFSRKRSPAPASSRTITISTTGMPTTRSPSRAGEREDHRHPSGDDHLWICPARVGGNARADRAGRAVRPRVAPELPIAHRQRGTFRKGREAQPTPACGAKRSASRSSRAARAEILPATAQGDAMHGTVELGGCKTAKWTAQASLTS